MNPAPPTNPSPGDYNYVLINTVPGWSNFLATPTFPQNIGLVVQYLNLLIQSTFAYAVQGGANPVQNLTSNDNFLSLDVIFTANLSDADVITLTGLVNRLLDSFIVTTDGSTSLGNPASFTTTAGASSSVPITLVYKQGDGSVRTGLNDPVFVNVVPTPIDTTTGNMDPSTGTFSFTFGNQTMKGTIPATLTVGLLPPVTLNVSWT